MKITICAPKILRESKNRKKWVDGHKHRNKTGKIKEIEWMGVPGKHLQNKEVFFLDLPLFTQ